MARYQQRITKQAERDLRKAIARYNSMLARFNVSGKNTVAEKITIQFQPGTGKILDTQTRYPAFVVGGEYKTKLQSTKEVRQYIQRLKDYRTLSDFETTTPQKSKTRLTKGQQRTLKRLDRNARKLYQKEIKKLEEQKTTVSNVDLINKIIPGINELKARPANIEGVRNRKSAEQIINRYEREQRTHEKYNVFDSGVSLEHFIASLYSIGLNLFPDGNRIIEYFSKKSALWWFNFKNKNPEITDLQGYVYDENIPMQEKVNAYLTAIGEDIDRDDLL